MSNWHGYPGGPLPGSPGAKAALLAKFEEECLKAKVTQAAVDARAAEIEARERAAAHQPWSKYPGVLAGDIEGRKQAQEAAAVPPAPEPPAPTLESSVTGNYDAQGAAIVAADRQTGQQVAESLLRIAPLPDGRGKR